MDPEKTSSASVAVAVSPALSRNVVIAVTASVVTVGIAAAVVKIKKARDAKKEMEELETEA